MGSVQYFPSAGLQVAYERRGSGPLVVFLHGIGGNRSNWWRQLGSFARRYCAVAWDARGYGGSDDPPEGQLKFQDFADDLRALLDHLGAGRAHLVGLSMGGMIIQDFYDRYPERVATLVLAGTSSGFGELTAEERHDFLERRLAPLNAGLTPADIAPKVVEVLAGSGADRKVRQELVESLSALRAVPYMAALRAIVTTDFRPVLPRIRVPTLVIVGSADRVLPEERSRALAGAIAGARLCVLPGIGHLSNIEAPAAFDAEVLEFLDAHATLATAL